ncbi:uncharacterized protein LOC117483261 [Trematomus bernacchii]|uniref:uncharacterized protein LOC117483261 n=1 Tax=Trematomus bernacchii TaxID=40690 RepID=UPI00146D8CD0|nr:uncharacterized protein LOC117483261 [Trematomus bernacchii]
MTNYITALQVSIDEAEEQMLQAEGFTKINVDLNKGAGGNHIYLWYKRGSCPITKVQVSFSNEMADGLINAGYTKIDKCLNAGAAGSHLYLWYFHGSGENDVPIVDISVTADAHNEAAKFKFGWERVACDLNRRACGNWIHVWLKREKQTYICEVTATDSFGSDSDYFKDGYIRLDEDTNKAAGGAFVFIWYRQTTDPKKALKDLKVSITDNQYQEYQQQNYKSVSVNLNEGTNGHSVYLWYKKKGCNNPIKTIALLVNIALIPEYEKAGLNVVKRSLNEGNCGCFEHLCVYQ